MSSPLTDAFEHHAWATLRVLDACVSLTDQQLATNVPGTYGSILVTLQHTVSADSWYLHRLGFVDEPISDKDEPALDVPALQTASESHAELWRRVVASEPDPDEMVTVRRDDGSATHASTGLRLAQAIHHGTDHRSQVCTALTSLGIEPPEIDLWAFGEATGRTREEPPASQG